MSTAAKRRLAEQADALGTRRLARQLRPWDWRMLIVGATAFLFGVALLAGVAHRYALVLGIALVFFGFVQVPITLFRQVRDHTRCLDWLAGIQKYHGRDRARYGN